MDTLKNTGEEKRIVLGESKANFVIGVVFLTLSLTLLLVIIPTQIADTGNAFPYPRTLPRFYAACILLLSLVMFYQSWRTRGKEGETVVFTLRGVGMALLTLAILIVSVVLLYVLPYIPVTIAMLAVLMRLFGLRSKLALICVAVILPVAVYYFFTIGLRLVLP